MINLISGVIAFDDGFCLGKNLPDSTVEKISLNKRVITLGDSTQIVAGTHIYQGMEWGVGVFFNLNQLQQVGLHCLNAKNVDKSAWSLENEKIRKIAHDEWLRKLIYSNTSKATVAVKTENNFNFEWGNVSSTLDLKGCQAVVVVSYL